MSTCICIPTKGRAENIKTLKLLEDTKHPIILICPQEETKYYLEYNDLAVIGCPVNGIGSTRHWIKSKYFDFFDNIVMIDDDIEKIVRHIDGEDEILKIDYLINLMIKEMTDQSAYFGGLTLCPNRFFTKPTVSTNLKYISGAFQVYIKKEGAIIPKVDYRHFEDYVYNIEYYLRDGKIIRYNNIIPITKNYNPIGGICADYGSLKKRLDDASLKADEIVLKYGPKIVKKVEKKKSSRGPACTNLRLNSYYSFTHSPDLLPEFINTIFDE